MNEDDELIERHRSGDESAFWELKQRHRPRCFDDPEARLPWWLRRIDKRLLWRYLAVFEELFDKVLRDTAGRTYELEGAASYRTYLECALRKRVCTWLKVHRRRATPMVDLPCTGGEGMEPDQLPSKEEDPAEVGERGDRLETVMHGLADLTPADRDIIERRFLHEQDYEEIARDYGENARTCRNRLLRAKKRLRKLLREKGLLGDEEEHE